jgi:hypothetical protein
VQQESIAGDGGIRETGKSAARGNRDLDACLIVLDGGDRRMAVDNRIHVLACFAELAMTILLDTHESGPVERPDGNWSNSSEVQLHDDSPS